MREIPKTQHQTAANAQQELFPPQKEVIDAGLLDMDKHLLLNMQTGSGKTFLAEKAIDDTLRAGYKAIYITPLKALATQQCLAWKTRFPKAKIGVYTSDAAAPDCAIHVFGCGNAALIPQLIQAGADSFDSSSYARDAVIKAQSNRTGAHTGLHRALSNLAVVNAAVSGMNENDIIATMPSIAISLPTDAGAPIPIR